MLSEDVNWRRITLNRPRALNSLNLSMVRELHSLLRRFEGNSRVFAVVLDAVGGKASAAPGRVCTLGAKWTPDHASDA